MFCVYCGKKISDDSSFCPYCGRNQEAKSYMYCHNCGNRLEKDSSFCPYCGNKQHHEKKRQVSGKKVWQFFQSSLFPIIKNRFFIWYILWILVNCILLYKSGDAYSNYFNSTNVSPDYWLSSDKGIFPEDWFYPFHNIFSGIMGQDPLYVYDISEFVVYVFIMPIVLALMIIKRKTIFKTDRKANIFYWVIWLISLWLLVFFPMGLLGLDFLGWSFEIGGLIIALYGYHKMKALNRV